jgi:hypothetical protein
VCFDPKHNCLRHGKGMVSHFVCVRIGAYVCVCVCVRVCVYSEYVCMRVCIVRMRAYVNKLCVGVHVHMCVCIPSTCCFILAPARSNPADSIRKRCSAGRAEEPPQYVLHQQYVAAVTWHAWVRQLAVSNLRHHVIESSQCAL